MSESMLRVAKRVEPELAEKNSDSKDEVWQDRVQQWRNGFMKQAKENAKQGKREKGGMDVSTVIFRANRTAILTDIPQLQEGHRYLLDKLLDEWKVSQAWDEKARDELVKEWHKLQGECITFSFNPLVPADSYSLLQDGLIRLKA